MKKPVPPPKLMLPLVIVLAGAAIGLWLFAATGSMLGVGAISLGRLAMLLGLVWLAWPSLQKPAEWLPSGITAIVLVCMGACAVQPRLLLVLVPLVGTLIGIGAAVRFLRKI